MRSQFTIEEIGEMLNLKPQEVEQEITNGHLNYTYTNGEKVVTLYDLEKYMGSEIAMQIALEYLRDHKGEQTQA